MSTDKNENRTKIKFNQDFLTQIPEWEQEYKEPMNCRADIGAKHQHEERSLLENLKWL